MRDSSAPRRILPMMALGSDPRAVALRVHLLFVFAGAVALGVGSVVLLIAAGVWLGAGGAGALVIRLPALVIHFVAWMLLLVSLKALGLSPNKDDERLMVQMMIAWCYRSSRRSWESGPFPGSLAGEFAAASYAASRSCSSFRPHICRSSPRCLHRSSRVTRRSSSWNRDDTSPSRPGG